MRLDMIISKHFRKPTWSYFIKFYITYFTHIDNNISNRFISQASLKETAWHIYLYVKIYMPTIADIYDTIALSYSVRFVYRYVEMEENTILTV